MDSSFHIAGELSEWPSRERLRHDLRRAGLGVTEGVYSLRVRDCSHFGFQDYGGDFCEPSIDADADSLEEMLRDAGLVSAALEKADIRHRFEVYDAGNNLVGYLHHRWPPPE